MGWARVKKPTNTYETKREARASLVSATTARTHTTNLAISPSQWVLSRWWSMARWHDSTQQVRGSDAWDAWRGWVSTSSDRIGRILRNDEFLGRDRPERDGFLLEFVSPTSSSPTKRYASSQVSSIKYDNSEVEPEVYLYEAQKLNRVSSMMWSRMAIWEVENYHIALRGRASNRDRMCLGGEAPPVSSKVAIGNPTWKL